MNSQVKEWLMGGKPRSRQEAGQAIIIIALVAIGLIAISGLAIDGGRLLLLRRDTQNASDASMLAATLALCSGGTEAQIIAAGETAAAANGFTDGVQNTTVLIDPNPPASEAPAGSCLDCAVLVSISQYIEPYFIQIVYFGDFGVMMKVVGFCNVDLIQLDNADSDGDGVPDTARPPIGPIFGGGTSCETGVQVSSGAIVGAWHSNGTVKFAPSNKSAGATCDNLPSPLSGGYTFGTVTYSSSGGGSGFQDAKSLDCPYSDYPGAEEEDEVVCGASCATADGSETPGDDGDLDPYQVDPYVDDDGDPIWPAEAAYDIADFRPGGSIAVALGSKYHEITSCSASIQSLYQTHGPGVYYTTCDIKLKKNDISIPMEMTLVSEATVDFHLETMYSGYYPQSAEPQHRLAIFVNGGGGTPSCGAKDLHVTSTAAVFKGIMYAPYGEAKFSTSSSETQQGCVVGYAVDVSSSAATIVCGPGEGDTRGSVSVLQ